MSSRLPPEFRPKQSRRMVGYQQPELSRFKRLRRRLFSPLVVIPIVFLSTAMLGVLGYYYSIFSKRIDRMLRGEIFTRSAGVYAAPRQLRLNEPLSTADLVTYLKQAGYVERGHQADDSRGRYQTTSNTIIEVEPGDNAVVDSKRLFPRLRIAFARDGKTVQTITDLDTNARVDKATLEPELISSVTGEGREKRRVIGFNDVPKHLISAITVTEDRGFFEHYGINLRGIARAFVRRYDADPESPIARQGGSSITQQLVKNLLLSPERAWRRKFAEAYMSIILETRLSKEEIFALYCNEVYLGQRAGFSINGFGEAAEAYFNKDVTQLTLPESAFLAGIIRSPNRYNPHRDLGKATERRNQVLQSMTQMNAITPLQSAQAQAVELKVTPIRTRIDSSEAPYFVDYVQNQLGEVLADGSSAQHLRIYTTIDMNLQRAAYAAVTKQLAALDKVYAKRVKPGTLQAALVAMNARTGEVVAMVGGRDYERSQLNRATDALRQPGSVFKPFVYAAALNTAYEPIPRVITPATTYIDEPKTFTFDNQEYAPGNFGEKYSGQPVTVRDALVRSLNVVTVDIATEVTIGRVMNLAAKAGLPKPARSYPAMALGSHEATPLQVASAYTAFAAEGKRISPTGISRITTGKGDTVVAPSGQRTTVLSPEVAHIMTSFMKDVINRGTAAKARARGFKHVAAGKTGTSRDGWFAGYTPNIVCAVWVGFDDGKELGMTGGDSALPIWTDFMQSALTAHPEWGGDWQMPGGLQPADIDPLTGNLATADNPLKRTELFINGTVPVEVVAPIEEEAVEEAQPGTSDGYTYQPAPLPPGTAPEPPPTTVFDDDDSPLTRPRRVPPPTLEGSGVRQPDGTTRLMVTVDIDPSTGLIAAPSCPVIRSKSFVVGQEPQDECKPEYHRGRMNVPSTRMSTP